MESPLRHLASDEYSSSWLKFHLGLQKPPPPRTKHPNPNQQRKQQQHLNTLGLRLNAAGNIRPSVIIMPSSEHRWKIHYSYKTRVSNRPTTDDAARVDPPASHRDQREWPRLESGKRSPHDGAKERTRARSAASATLARGREQRSPRIRTGTPELVTTTPIRLLGVLRSPEHAVNWRANDGKHPSPRYFTFPPVTGSRPGATSFVRQERREKVSIAPLESRSHSEQEEEEDLLAFSRSSSSESLPSAWKYADRREPETTRPSSHEVTDDQAQEVTDDPSPETSSLPTIDEEDASVSEASHGIRVHISRNNGNITNRYNRSTDEDNGKRRRLAESDEMHRRRVVESVDEDSDSLSVYDDDSEGTGEEGWTRDAKPSPGLPNPKAQMVDNEDINGDQNENHCGQQNEDFIGDISEDQTREHIEDHNKEHNEDHNRQQNEYHEREQTEHHIGNQNENHSGEHNGDHNRKQNEHHNRHENEDHSRNQNEDHIDNQNEDHNGEQNACHSEHQTEDRSVHLDEDRNGDQDEDRSGDQNADLVEDQNADRNRDLNEDQGWDQSGYLSLNEKEELREITMGDCQENDTWTKDVIEFSPTQRIVYPPLTSRGRASESPTIPREIPIANWSHDSSESIADEQPKTLKVLDGLGQIGLPKVGEVESSKEIGVIDIGYLEKIGEGTVQVATDTGDEGDKLRRGKQQQRDDESNEQKVECDITKDENNNEFDMEDQNEAMAVIGEKTSNNTDTDIEDSTKSIESDDHESLGENVVIVNHRAEANESMTATDESPMVNAVESDLDSKVNLSTSDLDQQKDLSPEEPSVTDEKLDNSSEEGVSLDNTIASQVERRSPVARKATRKRSVRFSQDVATVYLYVAATPTNDSDVSDSGFLSP